MALLSPPTSHCVVQKNQKGKENENLKHLQVFNTSRYTSRSKDTPPPPKKTKMLLGFKVKANHVDNY